MKATFWTAIGAMLIPLGVIVIIEAPSFSLLGVFLTLVGVASFIVGWIHTIREVRQMLRESEARTMRDKASLTTLVFMADQLGVDMSEFIEEE